MAYENVCNKLNMKIGILFCGYNSEEYVKEALEPFLKDKRFIVSAISVPFEEYKDQEPYEDSTTQFLKDKFASLELDYLATSPKFIPEADARNKALAPLLKEEVDYIWLVDADELYTPENINSIIDFIQENNSVWYKLCFKNYVFDGKQYLEEPFCPPRIFKTAFPGFYYPQFFWDNDISYVDGTSFTRVAYHGFSNLTVPKEVAWIKHMTWINNEIGKRKVAYQESHFNGMCSYKWNDDKKCLDFNEEYFKMTGEEKPKICKL